MKKRAMIAASMLAIALYASAAAAADKGAAIFAEKCASCHPNGGNVMNPKETLKGIKNPQKIIKQARKGGGGMPAFDSKTISDADLKQVADYIIKTFKK
jgi:cytochrome c6